MNGSVANGIRQFPRNQEGGGRYHKLI